MSVDRDVSFLLERSGYRVSNIEDLRRDDAVNSLGYRIHFASPTRTLGEMTRHQLPWVGPGKKHGILPWPCPRVVVYDLYGPDGRLLSTEPSYFWAVAQATNHIFSGAVL